jgi:hypothetical protein
MFKRVQALWKRWVNARKQRAKLRQTRLLNEILAHVSDDPPDLPLFEKALKAAKAGHGKWSIYLANIQIISEFSDVEEAVADSRRRIVPDSFFSFDVMGDAVSVYWAIREETATTENNSFLIAILNLYEPWDPDRVIFCERVSPPGSMAVPSKFSITL